MGRNRDEGYIIEENSKWYEKSRTELYTSGVVDSNNTLTVSYDAATVNWGDNWRMPTLAEIKELLTLKSEEAEVNGIAGRKFISTNGNALFLPFAGFRAGGDCFGGRGYYWSATVDGSDWNAYNLDEAPGTRWGGWGATYRCNGYSVRPVVKK